MQAVKALPKSLKEFFAYVLIDFATIDSDLEDRPLIEAAHFADRLEITDAFDTVVSKASVISSLSLIHISEPTRPY